MQRAKNVVLSSALSALALIGGCKSSPSPSSPAAESSPVAPSSLAAAQPSNEDVVFLDQGWSQDVREQYYHKAQGSAVISYDLFLNLEVANSQELFRSDANNDRYGLTSEPPNPQTNPDGLAIGLSKDIPEGQWKDQGPMIGLTCAACHNTELQYKGKRIRVDGASANKFDMMGYVYALDDAMQATLSDAAKFDRLADKLGASGSNAKSDLRKRFETQAARVHIYSTRTLLTPYPWGPARMDAIGLIVNRLTALEANIHENWSTAQAPTKPPFLWNSPQGLWTQWRAVQQDPINRNLTETMGVYMPLDLSSKTPEAGLFDSSASLLNLETIEDWLNRLAPPKWPEEVFGKIDRQKAAQGKVLFMANCARCHNSYPYTWTPANKYGKRFIEVGIIPQKYVGTDPMQFEDLRPYAITGQFSPNLPPPFKGQQLIPTGYLYIYLQREVLDKALAKLTLTDAEKVKLHGYRELPIPRPEERCYKAAPRDGVWATPPFMHNGSVPNLYEMLLPAGQRTKKFYLGREFDPIKVGLDTTGASGKYLVDTTLVGSSNSGHSFENGPLGNGVIGPLLTDPERWEIVEYLKSIPEEPGRVTPFGGTPNAPSGHGDWTKK